MGRQGYGARKYEVLKLFYDCREGKHLMDPKKVSLTAREVADYLQIPVPYASSLCSRYTKQGLLKKERLLPWTLNVYSITDKGERQLYWLHRLETARLTLPHR